jgi:hypothetical protein
MEAIAIGQSWQFYSDSTLIVKENGQIISDGTVPITISKRDGRTLVKMGQSVVEISNLNPKSMDLRVLSDLSVTLHCEKKM